MARRRGATSAASLGHVAGPTLVAGKVTFSLELGALVVARLGRPRRRLELSTLRRASVWNEPVRYAPHLQRLSLRFARSSVSIWSCRNEEGPPAAEERARFHAFAAALLREAGRRAPGARFSYGFGPLTIGSGLTLMLLATCFILGTLSVTLARDWGAILFLSVPTLLSTAVAISFGAALREEWPAPFDPRAPEAVLLTVSAAPEA